MLGILDLALNSRCNCPANITAQQKAGNFLTSSRAYVAQFGRLPTEDCACGCHGKKTSPGTMLID